MKKRKKEHRTYAAWNYDKEIERYNQKSKEGWQVTKMGCFSQTYEWDDTISYRYQIDYNADVMGNERHRYITTFEEQGWEYVNSIFNGWHCFRKKYRAELPAEEYEIYTDNSSKNEMLGRWIRLAGIMSIVSLALLISKSWHFFERISLLTGVDVLLFLVLFLMISLGGLSMYRLREGKTAKRRSPIGLIIIVLLVLLGSSFYFMFNRPVNSCYLKTDAKSIVSYQDASKSGYYKLNGFIVAYPDYYYLDLELNNDYRTEVVILDENDQVVYRKMGTTDKLKDERLKLGRGNYSIGIVIDESVEAGSFFEMEYKIQ